MINLYNNYVNIFINNQVNFMGIKITNIINDLILNNYSQVYIAKSNNVSTSYVSTIHKRLKVLKYKPTIINSQIICLECKSSNNLCIHHNHDTGQSIAILCRRCNSKLKNKTEFENGKLTNNYYNKLVDLKFPDSINGTTIRITKELAECIKELKITKLETYEEILWRLINEFKKVQEIR